VPSEQTVIHLLADIDNIHVTSSIDANNLSTLVDVSLETQRLWSKATTGLPILVSASSCWQTRSPSFEEIWIEAAKIKLKGLRYSLLLFRRLTAYVDLRVFERGEQGGVAAKAFCQLVKPDLQNPTYILGLEPPALIQDTPFRSNLQLHGTLTPYLEQHMVFNLTPQHSFVDLHIGTSKAI
jgi:hypothetical protein